MSSIGGYLGLELNYGKEYHNYGSAISLNTGRNALEYLLLANKYTKIYIPFYSCDVLIQPIIKLGITYEFYNIDENFEPLFHFPKKNAEEVFLYTNYFGLKDMAVEKLTRQDFNLIIDNAQAFYSLPLKGVDTFYSPRKFFGLADGAYLFSKKRLAQHFHKALSYERMSHLLKRIDHSAEEGYDDFVNNENGLNDLEIKQMSCLTKTILQSINYENIALKRRTNFEYLHSKLKATNLLQFELQQNQVPMVYPFYSDDSSLRNKLMDNKIYTAQYWPNVFKWTNEGSLEYKFAKHVICLPIDQRYNGTDLDKIINILCDEHQEK